MAEEDPADQAHDQRAGDSVHGLKRSAFTGRITDDFFHRDQVHPTNRTRTPCMHVITVSAILSDNTFNEYTG
jgi:hypothetical protein